MPSHDFNGILARAFAAQTAAIWPMNASIRPASHKHSPIPSAAPNVPLRMATDRGAPPIRIGSVSAR